MKPLEFDEVKDLIIAIRSLSDVEGLFFSSSYSEDQKVRYTLNLLHLGAKDWWKLVVGAYSSGEKAALT